MCPILPEVAEAPGMTHVGELGRSERLHKPRMGALCLCCPEMCKELERKRLLNHEKNNFSV